MPGSRFKHAVLILLLLGLSALTTLIAWQGVDTMGRTLARGGWEILWLGPLYLLPLGCIALGWQRLIPAMERPALARLLIARWIGFGANWLLPVARVGGDILRARLAYQAGVGGASAGASVIVDKTLEVANIVLFGVIGIGLLMAAQARQPVLLWGTMGLILFAAIGLGFYHSQRRWLTTIGSWFSKVLPANAITAGTAGLEQALDRLYRRRGALLAAACAHIGFRLGLTFEAWLALHLLGYPATFAEALILEGVTQVLRAFAFLVPAGLGIQEGAFMLLGSTLGIPPAIALSASLAKRARELLVGVPSLLAWQLLEGRRLLARSSVSSGLA